MSEVLVYDTEKNLQPDIPEEVKQRMSSYPAQNDPEYWSKVPPLFAEEFATDEAVSTFKTNWIVYRVPIYLNQFSQLEEQYFVDSVRMITERFPKDDWQKYFGMFTESEVGHSGSSYDKCTKSLSFQYDNQSYSVPNIGSIKTCKLHHIFKYEKETGKSIKDYDVIVELGGGIGEFARSVRDYGFEGDYYDVDFEPMCKIAEFYNRGLGNNSFVQHIKDLPSFKGKKVLFVGTWSFSETPFSYRDEVIKKMGKCDWLIAFQCSVFGNDNLNYFAQTFPQLTKTDYKLYCIPWHPFQDGNHYIFASPKA